MELAFQLSKYPRLFRQQSLPADVLTEAKKRVLDTLACFYGAFDAKPGKTLRSTFTPHASGECSLWGTRRTAPAELAAWANGTCVRTLDYNDTYLSKEPCHPSDLIAPLWAACELSGSKRQGKLLLEGMVLGYEVMCRLCDAHSLRLRGWDHVTYLPIASACASSYILGLTEEQTRNAIALSIVGNNAMRQTRVGTISDWKAACAAYAARSGLWAARLAKNGFTGPSDIFSGKHGFFAQVSGAFKLPHRPLGRPWKMMETHTKFFPAEHHAQSAVEAAIALRDDGGMKNIREITIETFKVAVDIIGSEKEKWVPTTRETADHSMPYLVVAALLDGDINLAQYEKKRYQDKDVRQLLARVRVKESPRYSRIYPKKLAVRVVLKGADGREMSREVLWPLGYAGRPMSQEDVEEKFRRLTAGKLGKPQAAKLTAAVAGLERVPSLKALAHRMEI